MKKSLMALAVLGALSGAASAQSSVTLYGIIDIGLQWNDQPVNKGTTGAPNFVSESTWGINGGYVYGSRFGLRGSEALGKGWNAVFTLEGGFNPDTGTSGQSGQLFGRQAWAGFQNDRGGTFVLGRIATPSSGTGAFDLWGSVDPFGTGWGLADLQNTFIPSGSLREDNSIAWSSPTWAGFKFGAQYSFAVFGQEASVQGANTSAWNLGANWTWGPLFLAATYDVISFPDATTATPCIGTVNGCPDQKMLQVGGTFDFKFLKVHAAYGNMDDVSLLNTVSGAGGTFPPFVPAGFGNYNSKPWMLGVSVPVFGGSLLGSYQYANAKNQINASGAQFEPDYSVWGIGYAYPFSIRTSMYVGYAHREWDGNIAVAAGQIQNVADSFDRSQFALGFFHKF